ncbi:TPA: hypothetical protein IGZ64_004210 [Escherichia coli]|nr:hypothetical protein [Escherichia coli]
MNIILEPVFMTEVRRRASLLSGCFNPGKAREWQCCENNTVLFNQLLTETQAFMACDYSAEDIKDFWARFSHSPELMKLIRCLNPGGLLLCQRGVKGDLYSVPVFHLVLSDFISGYLRQDETMNIYLNNLSPGSDHFPRKNSLSCAE